MWTDLRRPAARGRRVSVSAPLVFLVPAAVVSGAAQTSAAVPGEAGWDQPWFHLALGAAAVVLLGLFVLAGALRSFRELRADDGMSWSGAPATASPPDRWTSELVSTPGSGIRHACGQSRGQRERQEDDLGRIDGDRLAPNGNHSVALVADGMGGHAAGNVASQTAVHEFARTYGTQGSVRDRLRSALDRANEAIAKAVDLDAALSGMGTTMVAAAVTEQGLYWISVGDSPLYLFRAGRLERLNEDHSMRPVIARLVEEDPDAAAHYSPNQLLSVLMGDQIERTDAPATPRALKAGDIVLLTTDGIETLSEEETADVITEHRTDGPQAVVEALLTAVEAKGHPRQDNTTVVVVEVERSSVDGGSSEHAAEAVVAEPATEPPSDDADGRLAEIHGKDLGFEIVEDGHLPPAKAARCAGRKPRLRDVFRAWLRRRTARPHRHADGDEGGADARDE